MGQTYKPLVIEQTFGSEKNKLSVAERIARLIDSLGMSKNSFSKAIGLDNNVTIGRIINENRQPSFDILHRIIQTFGNVDGNWLLTGDGSMFKSEGDLNTQLHTQLHTQSEKTVSPTVTPTSKSDKNLKVQESKQSYKPLTDPKAQIVPVVTDPAGGQLITVIDARAAAGLPTDGDNPQFWKDRQTFSMPFPQFQSGEYVLMQISGDSMQPTIYPGDWVFCRRIHDWKEIRDGYIHVIVTKDGVVAKRVLNRVEKRQALALQSDNTAYTTYDEPIEGILQVWKVEMKMSATLRNEGADMRKDVDGLKKTITEVLDRLKEAGL